jgi:hypothetical protein
MTLQEAVDQYGKRRDKAEQIGYGYPAATNMVTIRKDYEIVIERPDLLNCDPEVGDTALWDGEEVTYTGRFFVDSAIALYPNFIKG